MRDPFPASRLLDEPKAPVAAPLPPQDGRVRKRPWLEEEDRTILYMTRRVGAKDWPKVASALVGRTADAVRNRWHRLQKSNPFAAETAAAAEAGVTFGTSAGMDIDDEERDKRERCWSNWTAEEDAILMEAVRRRGCKWRGWRKGQGHDGDGRHGRAGAQRRRARRRGAPQPCDRGERDCGRALARGRARAAVLGGLPYDLAAQPQVRTMLQRRVSLEHKARQGHRVRAAADCPRGGDLL